MKKIIANTIAILFNIIFKYFYLMIINNISYNKDKPAITHYFWMGF